VKLAGNAALRKLLCFSGGIFICFALVGVGTIHSFLTILGNFLIIKIVGKRTCHIWSFIYVFGYLLFFRTCERLGFPAPPSHSNAVQLLVTLRMVGMAYEIHALEETERKKKDDEKLDGPAQRFRICPNYEPHILDFFVYGYCYIGLMTGPYYSFQTFIDMIYQDSSCMSTVIPALKNLKLLPFMVVPYFLLAAHFPLSYMETDAFLEHEWGLAYQLLILVPTFTWFRWRFYLGWLLAEAMCITTGLGAYPFECEARPGLGPTKPIPEDFDPEKSAKEHNGYTHCFKTVWNIDIFGVEFGKTMRSAMKVWNMTVQWWMAMYVYKKLPVANSQIRMILLLFVSAFWHGVHPGYYCTFLSVPFVVFAETGMIKLIHPYLTEKQKKWFEWVTWFCLYRSFEYTGVGFMLLRINKIWKVWTRMYFIGHIFIALFIIIPLIVPKRRSGEKKEHTNGVGHHPVEKQDVKEKAS